MGWTKEQFVLAAFEEIGKADYAFDLQPEQLLAGLRRLDSMMAEWNGDGIRLGYPLPSSPSDSNYSADTNVPDKANTAIYANLAIRVAPIIGKTVSAETKMTARNAYRVLLNAATMPNEQQFPGTMPAGAGTKQPTQPFLDGPDDHIDAGDDSILDFS